MGPRNAGTLMGPGRGMGRGRSCGRGTGRGMARQNESALLVRLEELESEIRSLRGRDR